MNEDRMKILADKIIRIDEYIENNSLNKYIEDRLLNIRSLCYNKLFDLIKNFKHSEETIKYIRNSGKLSKIEKLIAKMDVINYYEEKLKYYRNFDNNGFQHLLKTYKMNKKTAFDFFSIEKLVQFNENEKFKHENIKKAIFSYFLLKKLKKMHKILFGFLKIKAEKTMSTNDFQKNRSNLIFCKVCVRIISNKMIRFHKRSRRHRKHKKNKVFLKIEDLLKKNTLKNFLGKIQQKIKTYLNLYVDFKSNKQAEMGVTCEICNQYFQRIEEYYFHFEKIIHQNSLKKYIYSKDANLDGIFSISVLKNFSIKSKNHSDDEYKEHKEKFHKI